MEGAPFAKDRSPRLTWRVQGTRSRSDEDKRRLREFSRGMIRRDRKQQCKSGTIVDDNRQSIDVSYVSSLLFDHIHLKAFMEASETVDVLLDVNCKDFYMDVCLGYKSAGNQKPSQQLTED
ncbi:hypothetical protein DAPPUDRAFT_327746 [Daphnia pulex]|uniref:Uncharacterized protein n=1 Tax=Daphnia pulex TaxID=6669 RepID=E9HBM5_DAPPU|nr:hypothetical protein DAPPUDRAFT_327746 [Daphnia pulex]|eukprot:EFX70873.1 hypothetical protein DAPPUDRAFT_327746 [Daphnia pulex]